MLLSRKKWPNKIFNFKEEDIEALKRQKFKLKKKKKKSRIINSDDTDSSENEQDKPAEDSNGALSSGDDKRSGSDSKPKKLTDHQSLVKKSIKKMVPSKDKPRIINKRDDSEVSSKSDIGHGTKRRVSSDHDSVSSLTLSSKKANLNSDSSTSLNKAAQGPRKRHKSNDSLFDTEECNEAPVEKIKIEKPEKVDKLDKSDKSEKSDKIKHKSTSFGTKDSLKTSSKVRLKLFFYIVLLIGSWFVLPRWLMVNRS